MHKFDTNGNLLMTLGVSGMYTDTGYDGRDFHSVRRSAPPFNRPTKAVVAPSGEVYVTDGYGNARVHKFSATGALITSWGEPGSGPGQFVLPHSLVIGKDGLVYVADRQNNRIQVFDANGKFIRMWQGVQTPMDMLIDSAGHMLLAEGAHRVSVWDVNSASTKNTRTMITQWGGEEGQSNDAGLFYVPHAIARDSRGVVYVGEVCDFNGYDRGNRAVQKFVPK